METKKMAKVFQWKVTLQNLAGVKTYQYVDVREIPQADTVRLRLERASKLKVIAIELV